MFFFAFYEKKTVAKHEKPDRKIEKQPCHDHKTTFAPRILSHRNAKR